MVESHSDAMSLNQFVFHFQKLGLELKCPLCLKVLNRPTLLPCDHIFCNSCVNKLPFQCLSCQNRFSDRETRYFPYLENVVAIYKSLDLAFNSTIIPFLSADSGAEKLVRTPSSKLRKKHHETIPNGKSDNANAFPSTHAGNRTELVELGVNHVSKASPLSAHSSEDVQDKDCFIIEPVGKNGIRRHESDSSKKSVESTVAPNGVDNEDVFQTKDPKRQGLNNISLKSFTKARMKSVGSTVTPNGADNESISQTEEPQRQDLNNKSSKSLTKAWMKSVGSTVIPNGVENECVSQTEEPKRQELNNKSSKSFTKARMKSVGSTVTPNRLDDENVSQTEEHRSHELNNNSSKSVLQRQGSKFKDTSVSPSTAQFNASHCDPNACAFCHSTRITEWTGPLLHVAGGKEVTRDDTDFPDATPVHKKCLEWSPQVYYDRNGIHNLEAELQRASELKCSRCGIKGASLGCLVESCQRSYHPPCAVYTDSRWDLEEYLMLCPRHVKCKFPNEKANSGKRRKIGDHSTPTESTSKWLSNIKWIFCASDLSSKEKVTMDKFTTICGATVLDTWDPNTTHVITSTESNGACKRTMEVLMAILNGRWVVTTNWIKACVEANCPVNEEPYEVNIDSHGVRHGPKTGRLRAAKNAPKLFDGLNFLFNGEFTQKTDLSFLVRAGGGTIIDSLEQRHDSQPQAILISNEPGSKDLKQEMVVYSCNNVIEDSKTMIVYDRGFPQGSMDGAALVVLQRMSDAEALAEGTDALVIPHSWILESVAACQKLPYPGL